MKYGQKGFGAIEVLLTILIVSVIGGAGAVVYSNSKKSDDKDARITTTTDTREKAKADTTTNDPVKTEDEQILLAAGCKTGTTNCSVKDKFVDNKISTVAWVTNGDEQSATNYFLSNDQGAWAIVYSGTREYVPEEVVNMYHIPIEWLNTQ